jgi:tetratricopeptide (TPR) repeat protein
MRISPTANKAAKPTMANWRTSGKQVESRRIHRSSCVAAPLCRFVAFNGLLALLALFPVLHLRAQANQDNQADFKSIAQSAAAARDSNDAPYAILLYKQALKIDPSWAEGWWNLGILQYGANDYAPAIDAFSHLIELSPNAAPAIALRGLCEFEIGDYTHSLADLDHGIDMGAASDPHNAGILRYHDALLTAHAGYFDAALLKYAFFAHGPAASPEIVESVGMAGLYISAFPKEIPNDSPQHDLAMAAGGAALTFMSGDTEKGGQEFEALFQRFPSAPNAHYFYGYLLFSADPDKAIAELNRELEIAPKNPAAEALLGWALMIQGDPTAARPHGERAVAEAPQLVTAQLVFGRSLVETGDIPAGLEHLQRALELDPANPEVHLALVKAYSKSGRKQDAQRERLLSLKLSGFGKSAIAKP